VIHFYGQAAAARKTQDTSPVQLFVEILNKYLYYFDQDLPLITPAVLEASPATGLQLIMNISHPTPLQFAPKSSLFFLAR